MSLVVKWFPKTLQRDVLELNENSFAWLHSDCCLARWATWCYCLTGPGDGRRVSAVQNLKLKFNFSGSGSQTVENCLWRKIFYKFFARVESNADKRCPWRFVNKTKTVINPRDWFFLSGSEAWWRFMNLLTGSSGEFIIRLCHFLLF